MFLHVAGHYGVRQMQEALADFDEVFGHTLLGLVSEDGPARHATAKADYEAIFDTLPWPERFGRNPLSMTTSWA